MFARFLTAPLLILLALAACAQAPPPPPPAPPPPPTVAQQAKAALDPLDRIPPGAAYGGFRDTGVYPPAPGCHVVAKIPGEGTIYYRWFCPGPKPKVESYAEGGGPEAHAWAKGGASAEARAAAGAAEAHAKAGAPTPLKPTTHYYKKSSAAKVGGWHAYALSWAFRSRSCADIAQVIRTNDHKVLRPEVNGSDIAYQTSLRTGHPNWESAAEFADWMCRDKDVTTEACTSELLKSYSMGRVRREGKDVAFDFHFRRSTCYPHEEFLAYKGKAFLSNYCLNMVVDADRPLPVLRRPG